MLALVFVTLLLGAVQDDPPPEPLPRPQPPLPAPRPQPTIPRPLPGPYQTRPRLPVTIDPSKLRQEPNVCYEKLDGFYCGSGLFVNVSYWCEAYQPMQRYVCKNGCDPANGQCKP